MDVEKDDQSKVLDLDSKRSKEERLKRLQRLIDAGEYTISASQIAESLLLKEPMGSIEDDEVQSEKNSKKE